MFAHRLRHTDMLIRFFGKLTVIVVCALISSCADREIPAAENYLMPVEQLDFIFDVEIVESILDIQAEKDAYRPKLQYSLEYKGMKQAMRVWYDTFCPPGTRTLCNVTVDILIFDSAKNAIRAIEQRYGKTEDITALPGLAEKAFKKNTAHYGAVNGQIFISITAADKNVSLDVFAKKYIKWFGQKYTELNMAAEH